MVVVVDNGVRQDLYMDGVEIFQGNQQGIDGRYSLADELLLFAAGNNQDGDDAYIDVSTVAIWDVPLKPNEILTLGHAGESVFKESLAPIVDAGVNQTVELDPNAMALVHLLGSIVDDNEDLNIQWQAVSGPNEIVIEPADSNTATATITAPGQYLLELSVNDGLYTVTDQVNFYNYHSIFDNSGNADDWEMWIYGDGRARFRVESDTAVTANLNNLAADGNGQDKWWHFTCTWARDPNQPDQVATQLYINGERRDKNAGTWVDPGETFFLGGGHPNNDFCNSTFNDVMIYNRVLSGEEILGLVYPENKPPVADAGEEQTVWLSEAGSVSVTLTGTVEDIDGSPIGQMTQLWEKVTGPDDIVIETPTALETVVTINAPGLYTFSLTASDGQARDTDEVIIDVWPFDNPGLIVHLPLDGNTEDVVGGYPAFLIDGADGQHEYVEGILWPDKGLGPSAAD